jgi:transposase
MAIVRIGLDIAKQVFQVHGVDGHGKTILRKTLSRSQVLTYFARLPVCLIGIEACSSSHYWVSLPDEYSPLGRSRLEADLRHSVTTR